MIEILILSSVVLILVAVIFAFKIKQVVLGLVLTVFSCSLVIWLLLNPQPEKITKVIIKIQDTSASSQLPDSLLAAAYQTEQQLALKPGFSVLSLKNSLLILNKAKLNPDSLKRELDADFIITLDCANQKFNLKINDKSYTVNSIKELKKQIEDDFDLDDENILPASKDLVKYFQNIINARDSALSCYNSSYYAITDRYAEISRKDSSKIRDEELGGLLKQLNINSDYWWKKSSLKIRILLSMSNYYEAFRIMQAQRPYLANQTDYYYLLSKFSYNRFKEFGYSSKFEIRELAKNHIGADLEQMAELAETYYLDGFNSDAEDLYRILAKIYPDDIHFLSQLGVVVSRLNRVEEAAEIFKQCILKDSTDWTLYYNLGIQYYWFAKPQAKQFFIKAIAKGDTANSLLFLGRIAFDEADYQLALDYFRQRVRHETGRTDPNWLEALKGIRRSLEQIRLADSSKVKSATELK